MSEVSRLLEESRKKLLDLTLRNSLLNYNLKRKNRLIIVDELPNVLYEKLLQGDTMKFDPVPYPEIDNEDSESNELDESNDLDEASGFMSAKKYAQQIGICIDEEVPYINNDETTLAENHIDNAIQTLHYPDTLERMLRKRRAEANTAIQERGTNLLYLVIGFLQWKQSVASEKILTAPLILIPVQIERGSPDPKTGVYSYKLSYSDEDLFSNISLQYKIKQEFGIEFPEFKEGETPEDYFKKINEICDNSKELIGVTRRFALDFFHFSKLLMYLDLDPSNWPKDRRIEDNPVLVEMAGETEPGGQHLSFEDIKEDQTENMGLVMDADSSQRDAIAQVMRGYNLIIEGPPGTGKSQTIANLIAVALSEGKSVLFVAEKLVALEVVKKRLDAVGLGHFILELHSHKSNKANFYASLQDRVDLEVYVTSQTLRQTIDSIESIKSKSSEYLDVLHKPQDVIGLTPYIVFGEVQNRQKEAFTHLPSEPNLLKINQDLLRDLSIELDALEQYIDEDNAILCSPWNGFETTNAISLDAEIIIELMGELKTHYQELVHVFDEDEILKSLLKTNEVLEIVDTVNSAGLLSGYPDAKKLQLIEPFTIENLKELIEASNAFIVKSSFMDAIDIEMLDDLDELRQLSRTLRGFKDIGFFGKWFNKEYKDARKKFNMFCIKENKKDAESMSKFLDSYRMEIEQYLQEAKNFYKDGAQKLAERMDLEIIYPNNIKDLYSVLNTIKKINEVKSAYEWKSLLIKNGFSDEMIRSFYSEDQQNYVDALKRLLLKSKPIQDKINSVSKQIEQYGRISQEVFFDNAKEFNQKYELLEQKYEYRSKLGLWIDVSRLLKKLDEYGLREVVRYTQENKLEKQIKNLIEYGYFREWAHKILRDNTVLAQFNRQIYESSLKNFRNLDHKLGSLYAKEHALSLSANHIPSGINGKVSEKTEMQLIRNEIRKQRAHLPIRQTIKRASKAIRALKPCFMMSPLSVSQFIDPSQEPFDLMIMDEASQIFPEDSLGAIARAKQVVVVGDPNQLPPTSFFGSSAKDEDDEETVATSAESILDLMLRVYPNVKRLKWHYRSQHESLIAFSNHHFYDSELMIFPSPDRNTSQVGITRKFIPNGFYKEQQNIIEAVTIVNEICEHLKHLTKESLGVVAMNKKQADLIDRLLEEKTKEDENIRRLVDAAILNNNFFIKNLENVQGDEADTLFIGTTYGPDSDTKKVYQRFGPINGDHGWRRMNVLITRAKKKIIVFTSMVSNDIIPAEGNRGRMALGNYLKYIESGHVESVQGAVTGKEPDSPFEESVIRYIQSLGFVAHPQVGVAGFYIDIGVMIEGSYNYILGIECDGAGYHSSKSARDRDRIRQDILESMGWQIYRIWSTDWFKHRSEEEVRLKNALAGVKNRAVIIEKDVEPINQEIVIEDRGVENGGDQQEDSLFEPDTNETVKPVNTSLKEALLKFREDVVLKKYIIDSTSILSDRMIDLLEHTQPITIDEFRIHIPKYLREKIDRNQMEFIDEIFEIIEENI
jgi:superfamily I DNA and/or RNA helicase